MNQNTSESSSPTLLLGLRVGKAAVWSDVKKERNVMMFLIEVKGDVVAAKSIRYTLLHTTLL